MALTKQELYERKLETTRRYYWAHREELRKKRADRYWNKGGREARMREKEMYLTKEQQENSHAILRGLGKSKRGSSEPRMEYNLHL